MKPTLENSNSNLLATPKLAFVVLTLSIRDMPRVAKKKKIHSLWCTFWGKMRWHVCHFLSSFCATFHNFSLSSFSFFFLLSFPFICFSFFLYSFLSFLSFCLGGGSSIWTEFLLFLEGFDGSYGENACIRYVSFICDLSRWLSVQESTMNPVGIIWAETHIKQSYVSTHDRKIVNFP